MELIAEQMIFDYFRQGIERRGFALGRRIGAELKFPLVERRNGKAITLETVNALWAYLGERGWKLTIDPITHQVVGATKPGEYNDTAASCETGFCKLEFSLAHVADLHTLTEEIHLLLTELAPFADSHQVCFLGCGIHPVSPPSPELTMIKQRTMAWDTLFPEGEIINGQPRLGPSLFTVNAGSHVHLSVSSAAEAASGTNLLNGFAGAQIALMANSSVWKGQIDRQHQCVIEKFWDWWMSDDKARVGLPSKSLPDLTGYAGELTRLRPLYVYRDEEPILINDYPTFAHYYGATPAKGKTLSGKEVMIHPEANDIKLHLSFGFHTARISRYFTVENRLWGQQPPDALVCPAALSLGLLTALPEATEELRQYQWSTLKLMREAAIHDGLEAEVEDIAVADLSRQLLELAELGLQRRGLGEEVYLAPLQKRLARKQNPAVEARAIFEQGGIDALIAARDIFRVIQPSRL